MWHLIVVDGGRKGGISYGSFKVYDDCGNEVTHNQFIIGESTSNQSEYLSLLSSMVWCLGHEIKMVTVLMDSKLVVNQTNGGWQCFNDNLKPLLKKVQRTKRQFERFEINHIERRYIFQKLGH